MVLVSVSDEGRGGGELGRWEALTPGSGGFRGLRTGLVFGVRGEAAAREMMQSRRRNIRLKWGAIRLERSRAWCKLLRLLW